MRGSSPLHIGQARHSHTCCLWIDLLAPIYTTNHHSSSVCLSVSACVCPPVRPPVGHWTRKRRVALFQRQLPVDLIRQRKHRAHVLWPQSSLQVRLMHLLLHWVLFCVGRLCRQFLGTCYIFRNSGCRQLWPWRHALKSAVASTSGDGESDGRDLERSHQCGPESEPWSNAWEMKFPEAGTLSVHFFAIKAVTRAIIWNPNVKRGLWTEKKYDNCKFSVVRQRCLLKFFCDVVVKAVGLVPIVGYYDHNHSSFRRATSTCYTARTCVASHVSYNIAHCRSQKNTGETKWDGQWNES